MADIVDPFDSQPIALKEKPIFIPAVKRGAGALVKDVGTVASALGSTSFGPGMVKAGEDVIAANPAQYSGMNAALEHPWNWLKESAGEQVAPLALMGAGGKLAGMAARGLGGMTEAVGAAGPMLPAARAALPIKALAGETVPGFLRGATAESMATGGGIAASTLPQTLGGTLQQQQENGQPMDIGKALPYALGSSALMLPAFAGAGTGVLSRALGKGLVKSAQEGMEAGVKPSLWQIPKAIGAGAANMGAIGAGQQTLEAMGGGTDLGSEKFRENLGAGIAGGAVMGGLMGIPHGVAQNLAARGKMTAEARVKEAAAQKAEADADAAKEKAAQAQIATQKAGTPEVPGESVAAATVKKDQQTKEQQAQALQRSRDLETQLANRGTEVISDTGPQTAEEIQIADTIGKHAELDRASKLYDVATRAIESGTATDLNAAVQAREMAAAIMRKHGVEPSGAEVTPEQMFTQEQQRKAKIQAQRQAPVTPEVARATAVANQQHINSLDVATAALTQDPRLKPAAKGLIEDHVLPLGSVPEMAKKLNELAESKESKISQNQRAILKQHAVDLGYAKEEAGAEPAVKKPQNPALEGKKNEPAPAEIAAQNAEGAATGKSGETGARTESVHPKKGEGIGTPETNVKEEVNHEQARNAETAAGQRPEVQEPGIKPEQEGNRQPSSTGGKHRTEEVRSGKNGKPVSEGQKVGEQNGLQTEETRNAKTPEKAVGEKNAVQERGTEAHDVGAAPGHRTAMGEGVPESEKPAAKGRNAETKEEVKRRESSQDYPEYWEKRLHGKGKEQGKLSESASALDTMIRLLTDPKTGKVTFKGKEGEKINHALYALVSEAEAIGVPKTQRYKVHDVSREFVNYAANAGETWAKRVASAKKQLVETEAKLEAEDKAIAASEEAQQVENKKALQPKLGEEQQQPGKAKITVFDENGKEQHLTQEEYAKMKREEKRARKAAEKGKNEEVPNLEPTGAEDFEGKAEALPDAVSAAIADKEGSESFLRTQHKMPNQPEYDAVIQKGDVVGIHTLIQDHFKGNSELQKTLKWAAEKSEGVKVKHEDVEMTDEYGRYVPGGYDAINHTITIYRGGSNPVTLAHEIVHAALVRETKTTQAYMERVRNGEQKRTELMEGKVKAFKAIESKFEEFKKLMPNSNEYGLHNVHEFLAEVFSNPDFRAALRIEPEVPFWRGLLRMIARLFDPSIKKAELLKKEQVLQDIFDAADLLAYRSPGAVYLPADMKQIFWGRGITTDDVHTPGLQGRIETAREGVRPKTLMEAVAQGAKKMISSAKDTISEQGWSLASADTLVDLLKKSLPEYGKYNELNGKKVALATIKTTQLGEFFGDYSTKIVKNNPKLWAKIEQVVQEGSNLKITETDARALAEGKATFDSLLKKQWLTEKENKGKPEESKKPVSLLKDTPDMRARVEAFGKLWKSLGGDKDLRFGSKLPKDRTDWTGAEWASQRWQLHRDDALANIETQKRNLYTSVTGDHTIADTIGESDLDNDYKVNSAELDRRWDKLVKGETEFKPPSDIDQRAWKTYSNMANHAMELPYEPTHRTGDFFVSLYKPKESDTVGEKTEGFMRFESEVEARDHMAEVQKEFAKEIKDGDYHLGFGKLSDFTSGKSVEGMTQFASVMKSKLNMLEAQGLDEKSASLMRDALQQELLRLMPETGNLKSMLHKKGTPGWDINQQMQGSLNHLKTGAYHYANNRYLAQQEALMKSMKERVRREEQPTGDMTPEEKAQLTGDPIGSRRALNEVIRRHAQSFDDLATPVVDKMRAFTYHYQLALSPGFILNNLTQPTVMTIPELGSRYGFVHAVKELVHGYSVAFKVIKAMLSHGLVNNVPSSVIVADLKKAGLGGHELAAVEHMLSSGKVEFTLAKEAGMLGRGMSIDQVNMMKYLSLAAHYPEVLNRISSGVAGYSLEMKHGSGDYLKAEERALKTIDLTQGNYNPGNMPRAMGKHGVLGAYTPLISTFMYYNTLVIEAYARHMRDIRDEMFKPMMAGESATPEGKRALKAFTGMLLTTASVAGTMGLPFMSLISMALNFMMGDDDKPYDFDESMREFGGEWFGKTGGLAFNHGLPSLVGLDMYARAGQQGTMPFTRFLTDHRNLHEMPADVLLGDLSPVLGTVAGIGMAAPKIYDWIANNDMAAGTAVIRAMPAALRGLATAAHGYYDTKGTEIPNQNTALENAAQILGYPPEWRLEQQFQTATVKERINQLNRYGTAVKRNWVLALQDGNTEKAAEFQTKWQEFVAKNPDVNPNPGIAEAIKKANMDRMFYKMTGSGVRMTPAQMQQHLGVTQYLNLPEGIAD